MTTTEDAAYEIAQWAKFESQCRDTGEIEMTAEQYAELRTRVAQMGLSAFTGDE